ncbi:hypothetical protein, partial [Bosea massiliensis]
GDLSVQGWRSQPKPNRQSPVTTVSYTTLWDTTVIETIGRGLARSFTVTARPWFHADTFADGSPNLSIAGKLG